MWQSSGCVSFLTLKFNPITIKINVENQTLTEGKTQTKTSRFFYNKASAGLLEIGKSYTQVINPKLILDIIGPLGLILLVYAFSYTIKKPSIKNVPIAVLTIVVPFFVLATSNSKLAFFVWSITLFIFSSLGVNLIKPSRLMILIFVLLAIINLWYFAFSWQMQQICNEIFFH